MKSLKATYILEYIIKPTLLKFNLWSENAEKLILLTCAHESLLGKWVQQIGGGPAVGIYQMEPATYFDIIQNVIPVFKKKIGLYKKDFCPDARILIYDVQLATLMCRLQYARFDELIPSTKNFNQMHDSDKLIIIEKLALYYKRYYNTDLGKASVSGVVKNYINLIGLK